MNIQELLTKTDELTFPCLAKLIHEGKTIESKFRYRAIDDKTTQELKDKSVGEQLSRLISEIDGVTDSLDIGFFANMHLSFRAAYMAAITEDLNP